MSLRPIKQVIQTKSTEGAGVKLQRAFGFGKTKDFDPFLLSTISATTILRTIWPVFRGTLIAALKPSPMCWPARSNTGTASGTKAA